MKNNNTKSNALYTKFHNLAKQIDESIKELSVVFYDASESVEVDIYEIDCPKIDIINGYTGEYSRCGVLEILNGYITYCTEYQEIETKEIDGNIMTEDKVFILNEASKKVK